MANTNAIEAKRWQETAERTLSTAQILREQEDARSCVSRAYYAVFQRTTAVCIAHGDAAQFPTGWNNPSHQQLPDLIYKKGIIPRLLVTASEKFCANCEPCAKTPIIA